MGKNVLSDLPGHIQSMNKAERRPVYLFDTPMGTALQGPAHLLLSACSAGSRQELQPWACVCHSIMRVGTDRQPPLIKLSLQSGFSTAPKSISLIFSSAYFSRRVPWRVTWNGRTHGSGYYMSEKDLSSFSSLHPTSYFRHLWKGTFTIPVCTCAPGNGAVYSGIWLTFQGIQHRYKYK